jgi:acetolactate synthase-1/2/3 large subunit
LSVPVDLLGAEVENHAPLPRGPIQVRRPGPEPTDLERAIELLEGAERPAVIAGSGAWWADAGGKLQAFIEKASLPLFTIGLARGLVSDNHPLCFGYADPTLNRAAEGALRQADVILVIGKKLDYRLRLGSPQLISPDAKVIQIDIHGPELGLNRRVDVGMVADAKLALEDFVEALQDRPQRDRSAWIAEVGKIRDTTRGELEAIAQKPSQPMHPLQFFREMLPWLREDFTLCWDGGDFVHWGRNYIPARKPMHWLRLGALAGLGVCFPIGLAAQIARPDSRAVVITGDGSLGFYLAEMDTAVRFNLPVIIIVGNDGGWGIERELQRGAFGGDKTVACELRRTRYDLVMKAFGGDGEFVERPDQIRPALDRALRSDKPFLINVDIKGVASPFTEYQLRGKK